MIAHLERAEVELEPLPLDDPTHAFDGGAEIEFEGRTCRIAA